MEINWGLVPKPILPVRKNGDVAGSTLHGSEADLPVRKNGDAAGNTLHGSEADLAREGESIRRKKLLNF